MNTHPRIALAANRKIGVQALQLLLDHDLEPIALMVADGKSADTSVIELKHMLPNVPKFVGKRFRSDAGIASLAELKPDYLLSIHFPYIVPQAVLDIPRIGALNLHPAYLPFNRGWHTPSWAILEQTPYGATLHWIDAGMDTGDIALQREVKVQPDDTANSLYARVLTTEIELFEEAIPLIKSGQLPRVPQQGKGTEHVKADLDALRKLELNEQMSIDEVLRKIRALSTNRDDESAWFEVDGIRYFVRLSIQAEAAQDRIRRAA